MRGGALLIIVAAGVSCGAAAAVKQAASARVAAASQAASAPASNPGMATNIDRALAAPLTVTYVKAPLKEVFASLRKDTNTNLVINWAALAKGGVTQDTPITLTLKAAPYEEVVRCILEILPLNNTRGNYEVGGNALVVTTTGEMTKGASPQLYNIERAIVYSAAGKASAGQQSEHARIVEKVVQSELERSGEPLDKKSGRNVAAKGSQLVANVSQRGHGIIERTLPPFAQPVKPNAPVINTVLPLRAGREAAVAIGKIVKTPADLLAVAKDPAKAEKINVVLLPGAAAELAKPAPALDYLVSPGGTMLIGSAAEIGPRHPLVIYDLRDILKRTIARSTKKPPPAAGEVQDTLVKALKAVVPAPAAAGVPGTWGDIGADGGRGPAMLPTDGLLIVVAPVATHEKLAAALAQLYK